MKTYRIFLIFIFVFSAFLFGTLGFYFIEGWNFIDSLYMTVITLTTVGFGEVHPLSESGKLFTVVLIVLGLGVVTYSISAFMTYLISFDFQKRRRDKMQKKIDQLSRHTIVCGFGRMGSIVCKELAANNNNFVVIEKDPELVAELKKSDFLWVEGDAAHEEFLELAGINRCKVLVSMVDNDSDALYISLVGRSFSKDLFIICRANDEKAKLRILRAGADKVVLPMRMTALRVAESVLNPAVEDFLDISGVEDKRDDRIQLADLFVTKESLLVNRTLGEKGADIDDLIIVGVRKTDKSFVFKPSADYAFQEGDCLIAMGTTLSYRNALNSLKLDSVTPH